MAAKKKKETKETPVELLRVIGKGWDLGPAMNKRIEATSVGDPLRDVPDFIEEAYRTTQENDPDDDILCLGELNGFELSLYGDHDPAALIYGCEKFSSEAKARAHFYTHKNGEERSRRSEEERPNTSAMITWIAAICEYRGWRW